MLFFCIDYLLFSVHFSTFWQGCSIHNLFPGEAFPQYRKMRLVLYRQLIVINILKESNSGVILPCKSKDNK